MKLWHEALIPYLPKRQLLEQHREISALRSCNWGSEHSTVDYVFKHPYEWLVAYHGMIMEEMKYKGCHVDRKWHDLMYRGEKHPAINHFDLETYWNAQTSTPYIYPEHNEAYLKECLDSLEAEGVHIKMEEK